MFRNDDDDDDVNDDYNDNGGSSDYDDVDGIATTTQPADNLNR